MKLNPKLFKSIFHSVGGEVLDVPLLRNYVAENIDLNLFQDFDYSASWDDSVDNPCDYCGPAGAGKGKVYFFPQTLGEYEKESGVYRLLPKDKYEEVQDYLYVCCCGNCKAWWINAK